MQTEDSDWNDELEAMTMLRQMTDMPVGTIGFEGIGDVEDDDWEDTVEPVLRQEKAKGFPVHELVDAKSWLAAD